MPLKKTRACIDAILDGSVENSEFESHPVFQFDVPKTLSGVSSDTLAVKPTWENEDEYEATLQKLAGILKESQTTHAMALFETPFKCEFIIRFTSITLMEN